MNLFNKLFGELNLSHLSINNIRLSDILDIIIVAVLIYIIINWIKETRAWSLFKGILVVLILSLLSVQFNLYTFSWIIENTLSVGIIAILVLFQPEFRKALEQLGKRNLFSKIFYIEDEENLSKKTLDEIIIACFTLAQKNTGALIVIEKDVPLGDFEDSGISLDAIVSNQLLINIFENKTPLHDGAVLIRNNRITSASCILPLTQTKIGADLGTRHRASVGVTEVSDSYAIVVSEETGSVSVAHKGKLYKNLSKDKITKMLDKSQKVSTKKLKISKSKLKSWKKRGDYR